MIRQCLVHQSCLSALASPCGALAGAGGDALVRSFFLGGGVSDHGKLAKAAHQKALEKTLGIKDQSCPMLQLSHKAMW